MPVRRGSTASVRTAVILVIGMLIGSTPVATQELPLAPMRTSGQSVTAAYEGWFRGPDGQISLLVGYFNRNTEEILDIPVGPTIGSSRAARIMASRRTSGRGGWGVFAIPLPPDFGDRRLTWTIVVNGQTTIVPMGLTKDYEVEPYREPAQGNTPPVVKFLPNGDLQQGPPLGISAEYEATVNEPLTITLWATDDGQVDPNRRALEGAPVRIRWSHHRGAGDVVFSEPRPETDEATGETTTTVTFGQPGEYVLRAQANDSSGATTGFQCCWTNAHVKVTVSR